LTISAGNSSAVYIEQAKTDLERLGWRVIIVWECELRTPDQLAARYASFVEKSVAAI